MRPGEGVDVSDADGVVRISLPADAYQNWNLDYLQLAPARH